MRQRPGDLSALSSHGRTEYPSRDGLEVVFATILRMIFRVDKFNTVFVGSEANTSDAPFVSLELAREAARYGYRVLLIECAGGRSNMAGSIDENAVPMLVGARGLSLVVLPDTSGGDLVHLAPAFRNSKRIISGLSQRRDVVWIAQASERFDLVVIDGDTIDGSSAKDWLETANKTILVSAKGAVQRERNGLDLAGCKSFLGTIVSGRAAPAAEAKPGLLDNHRPKRLPNKAMAHLFSRKMKLVEDASYYASAGRRQAFG